MIAIIDYGMGNIGSVAKACKFLGARARVTDSPAAIRRADGVIFPGVGAFGAAMRELKRRRLIGPIREVIQEGKPFLGLCLGLQLLFDASEESPGVEGLGVLPGRVRRFRRRPGLKVPHVGWNKIEILRRGACTDPERSEGECAPQDDGKKSNPLLKGVPDGAFLYFVHSFYADPESRGCVAARTEYGRRFPSVLWDGQRLWATQFHPEKSQKWGLTILRNFLKECSC